LGMGRLRLLGAFLLIAGAALAQRQMTVPQLVGFIKSSIQMKNDDRTVADYVRKLKLTNQLDGKTVEELQGMGAGPRTVAALRALITTTASLPAAPAETPAPPRPTIPPPSAEEQNQILAEITQNALDYNKKLPNFICTQVTRRHFDPSGTNTWRPADTIQEQLSYVDGSEKYKVVLINSLPVTISHEQLGGTTTSGEFGSTLLDIFTPETHTTFAWERWATLRSRRMYVYSFRVQQSYSRYTIDDRTSQRSIVAGYHGLIYADRENKMVMRITMEADGLESFPVNKVSMDLNYDFVKISDQEFVLPLKADLHSSAGRYMSWNEVEFRLYRKFGAESTIVFDAPDPISDEQLKEQPAR